MNKQFVEVHAQAGVAFVIALLYLLVLTLITSSLFSTGLLQFKMSQHFEHTERAFQNAESALMKGEVEASVSLLNGEGRLNNEGSYRFERLPVVYCGFWLYQVSAIGMHLKAVKKLESIMVLPVYDENCPDIRESRHRVRWREL